jgi:hypothetical protein
MKFTSFEKGFSAELANRVFARKAMAILAARTRGLDSAPFWRAYHLLEEHNAPIFAAAARRLGVRGARLPLARLRGWLTGHTPLLLLAELLRFAYPRTVEYAEDLKRLRDAGPQSEREFLDYMVRQEELQVRMMHLALISDYRAVSQVVQEFLVAERR